MEKSIENSKKFENKENLSDFSETIKTYEEYKKPEVENQDIVFGKVENVYSEKAFEEKDGRKKIIIPTNASIWRIENRISVLENLVEKMDLNELSREINLQQDLLDLKRKNKGDKAVFRMKTFLNGKSYILNEKNIEVVSSYLNKMLARKEELMVEEALKKIKQGKIEAEKTLAEQIEKIKLEEKKEEIKKQSRNKIDDSAKKIKESITQTNNGENLSNLVERIENEKDKKLIELDEQISKMVEENERRDELEDEENEETNEDIDEKIIVQIQQMNIEISIYQQEINVLKIEIDNLEKRDDLSNEERNLLIFYMQRYDELLLKIEKIKLERKTLIKKTVINYTNIEFNTEINLNLEKNILIAQKNNINIVINEFKEKDKLTNQDQVKLEYYQKLLQEINIRITKLEQNQRTVSIDKIKTIEVKIESLINQVNQIWGIIDELKSKDDLTEEEKIQLNIYLQKHEELVLKIEQYQENNLKLIQQLNINIENIKISNTETNARMVQILLENRERYERIIQILEQKNNLSTKDEINLNYFRTEINNLNVQISNLRQELINIQQNQNINIDNKVKNENLNINNVENRIMQLILIRNKRELTIAENEELNYIMNIFAVKNNIDIKQVNAIFLGIDQKDKNEDKKENKIEIKNGPKEAFIVDTSEIVKAMAWRQAEDQLNGILYRPEDSAQPKRGWAASVWNAVSAPFRDPGGWVRKQLTRSFEDGYRKQFYSDALREITNNQNLMNEIEQRVSGLGWRPTSRPGSRDRNYEVLDKVIEEYENGVTELMERGQLRSNPNINAMVTGLIAERYLNGWTREQFDRELRTRVNDLKNARPPLVTNDEFTQLAQRENEAEGLMYASNIWKISENYEKDIKAQIEKIGNLDKLTPEQKEKVLKHVKGTINLDVKLGLKMADIHNKRPKDCLNWLDRIAHRVQSTPILGTIVNPLTIGVVSSCLTNAGIRKIAGGAVIAASTMTGFGMLAPILTGALLGGAYGAARRNKELKFDRNYDLRRMALEQPSMGHRTDVVRRFGYNMRNANELNTVLDNITGTGSYNNLSADQKEDLADMWSRFKIESQREEEFTRTGRNNTVDLISAASVNEAERLKTNYVSKTDLKIKLYNYLRSQNLLDANNQLVTGEYNNLATNRIDQLNNHIDHRDRDFRSYKTRQAVIFGGIGFTSGLVGGIASQEVSRYVGTHWLGQKNYITALDWVRGKRPQPEMPAIFGMLGGNKIELNHGLDQKYEYKFKGKSFNIFFDKDGKPDFTKSELPKGWEFSHGKLVEKIPAKAGKILSSNKNWSEYSQELVKGTDAKVAHVSHVGFQHNDTPPAPGVYSIADTPKNYSHNAMIYANKTELGLNYFQDKKTGDVMVDLSGMYGKISTGTHGNIDVQQLIEQGKARVYMAYSPIIPGEYTIKTGLTDQTQFQPILTEIHNKITKVPTNIANAFYNFDKNGNFIPGPNQPGLHTVVVEVDELDGTKSLVNIAATVGEELKKNIEIKPLGRIIPHNFITTPKVDAVLASAPFATPIVPRWPLETGSEQRKNKDNEKVEKNNRTNKEQLVNNEEINTLPKSKPPRQGLRLEAVPPLPPTDPELRLEAKPNVKTPERDLPEFIRGQVVTEKDKKNNQFIVDSWLAAEKLEQKDQEEMKSKILEKLDKMQQENKLRKLWELAKMTDKNRELFELTMDALLICASRNEINKKEFDDLLAEEENIDFINKEKLQKKLKLDIKLRKIAKLKWKLSGMGTIDEFVKEAQNAFENDDLSRYSKIEGLMYNRWLFDGSQDFEKSKDASWKKKFLSELERAFNFLGIRKNDPNLPGYVKKIINPEQKIKSDSKSKNKN